MTRLSVHDSPKPLGIRPSPVASVTRSFLLLAALGSGPVGCSSSDTGSGGSGAGGNAGGAEVGGGEAGGGASATILKCGDGGVTGTLVFADTTFVPIPNAKVTGPGCVDATADSQGSLEASFTVGEPLKLLFTATGYIPESVEATPVMSGFNRTAYLASESLKSTVLTDWTSGDGYAVVSIAANPSATGPCATADGLVVSVSGHPELAVGYMSDTSTRSATLMATNTLGLAVVGPMPPGRYEFNAAKTGCVAGPDLGMYFTWPQAVDVDAETLSFVQLKLP